MASKINGNIFIVEYCAKPLLNILPQRDGCSSLGVGDGILKILPRSNSNRPRGR